jgi:signal transduction histidine kinase/CheY-like chemotaxis protein
MKTRKHPAPQRRSVDERTRKPPRTDTADRRQTAIRDVMNRDVVCLRDDVSMDTLEELLLSCDLSGVPVVDAERRLVGYVTMTDIVRELHDRGDTGQDQALGWGYHIELVPPLVAEVMTPVPFELQESCAVVTAIELMTARRIHRVPVVSEDGVLVGVVTASDVLRYLAGREPQIASPRPAASETDRVVSLGLLTGGLAHQVNNALTPMRLTLGRLISFELSRRPLTVEHTHRIELLQDLREGVDRIERVVREQTVFSNANDAPIAALGVIEVLEAAIGVAAHEIRHRARLVRDYQPVPRINARPADLRQVFLNLLINAVYAIREGEAHLNEVTVRTWTDDRGLANIEIRDTGAGIPPETLPHIFEPFFTTHPGRALGLGLAVTRELVTALGGSISVDSVVGGGTAIQVALPASEAIVCAAPVVDPSASAGPPLAPRRILIVDDDRPVAAAIALELDEHDVVVAESGREALEILRRDTRFDMILCDLMMPEISGQDVYEALRLTDPALIAKFVLMTGGAFTRGASGFLSSVDAPVLEKPFDAAQLRDLVNRLGPRDAAGAHVVVTADVDPGARSSRARKES